MGLGRFISFLGVVALFGPSATLAQGTITGINYEPTPAVACTLETIKVTGVGSCPFVNVNFEDQTPIAVIQGVPFPVTVYHIYKKAGTFPLEAYGSTGTKVGGLHCKLSKVSTNLNVVGPTVTGIFPLANVATSQADLILEGQHFGSLPGQVLLHLMDYTGNNPVNLQLKVIQWMDTAVAVNIPPVSRVLKQQATLTLITQCGASTTWDTEFTPLNDTALIPWERVTCWTSKGFGVSDFCQTMGGTNWPIECGLGGAPFLPGPSGPIDFRGWHASGIGGGSSGYDQFWLPSPLQNSWVFTDLPPPFSAGSSGGSQATFSVNASNASAPVVGANWHADACNLIEYGGDMYIEGPSGVPY